MFLVGPKGFKADGNQKVLMTGYGGFEVRDFSVPRFIGKSQFPTLLPWHTQGNIVAIPHIRGGGEYGKKWHEAGKKQGKLKTYQDFASAASWLVQNNMTTVDKIAAWGRSNGGLLIAAVS